MKKLTIEEEAKEVVDNMKFEKLVDFYLFQKGRNSALQEVKGLISEIIFKYQEGIIKDLDEGMIRLDEMIEGLMKK